MEPKDRIIAALDLDDPDKAMQLVKLLASVVGMFKVGKQLFVRGGPDLVRAILKEKGVFLDLKFHDIPNTVMKAGIEAMKLGVRMFNVHCSGGLEMMETTAKEVGAEAKKLNREPPWILGVTVLTSLDASDFAREGVVLPEGGIEELVWRRAALAKECGLDGAVSSPQEVKVIRKVCGPDFKIIPAGIRPADSKKHDQVRTGTPGQAIKDGADYIVVGRPIIEAADPVEAAKQIADEIAEAMA